MKEFSYFLLLTLNGEDIINVLKAFNSRNISPDDATAAYKQISTPVKGDKRPEQSGCKNRSI